MSFGGKSHGLGADHRTELRLRARTRAERDHVSKKHHQRSHSAAPARQGWVNACQAAKIVMSRMAGRHIHQYEAST
jgi:hypothetical protein